jgi:cytochrome c biogenesis protein CcdA
MLHLVGLVISIGLADGMNPSSIGPSMYLASGRRPVRGVLRFAAGYMAVMFAGGLLLTLGPGHAIISIVPRPGPTVRYGLETAAGAVMLAAAGLLAWRRRALATREASPPKHLGSRSPLSLGATISAVELPTAFPYFAAIAAIVGSGLDIVQQSALVGIYQLFFALPMLVIAGAVKLAGERALSMIARARLLLHAHWPALVAGISLIAGVVVTVLGVTGLELHAHGAAGTVSRGVRGLLH